MWIEAVEEIAEIHGSIRKFTLRFATLNTSMYAERVLRRALRRDRDARGDCFDRGFGKQAELRQHDERRTHFLHRFVCGPPESSWRAP